MTTPVQLGQRGVSQPESRPFWKLTLGDVDGSVVVFGLVRSGAFFAHANRCTAAPPTPTSPLGTSSAEQGLVVDPSSGPACETETAI